MLFFCHEEKKNAAPNKLFHTSSFSRGQTAVPDGCISNYFVVSAEKQLVLSPGSLPLVFHRHGSCPHIGVELLLTSNPNKSLNTHANTPEETCRKLSRKTTKNSSKTTKVWASFRRCVSSDSISSRLWPQNFHQLPPMITGDCLIEYLWLWSHTHLVGSHN